MDRKRMTPDSTEYGTNGTEGMTMFQRIIGDFTDRGRRTQVALVAAVGAVGVALVLASGAVLSADAATATPTCSTAVTADAAGAWAGFWDLPGVGLGEKGGRP